MTVPATLWKTPLHNFEHARYLHENKYVDPYLLMIRDPFDGLSGDELDPQAAEADQLATIGMHTVEEDEEDDLDEAGVPVEVVDAEPADERDKDGLEELEAMEKQILEEDPVLDFAMAEDDE